MAVAARENAQLNWGRAAVEAIVARLAGSRLASAVAIVIVALACMLPGLTTIQPIDREEPHFAQAVKRMVETGGYRGILDLGEPDNGEPIGMYWLQAGSVWLSGEGAAAPIWVYRLPSLVGAIAVGLLTWWMALAFGRPRAALLAGVLMAANCVLVGEARLARSETTLLAAIVLAEGALARLWLAAEGKRRPLLAMLFWVGLGVGILVKGPVAVLVLALPVVALSLEQRSIRWLKRLEPLPGVILLAAILSLWVMAALMGGSSTSDAARRLAEKIGTIDFRAPPGTYALLFFAIFWPAASFFVLGIPWFAERLRDRMVVFALAAGVPFWLLTELYPTKLAFYVLPAFPALTLLAAAAVDAGAIKVTGWLSWFFSLGPVLVPGLIAVGVPVGLYLLHEPIPMAAMLPLAGGAVVGTIAWRWLVEGSGVAACVLSVVAAVLVYVGVFGLAMPYLGTINVSGRLLAASERARTCPQPQFATAGYPEESLAFLNPIKTQILDGAGAANFLNRGGCRLVVVEGRQLSSFRQRAEDLGLDIDVRGRVQGFDLGNGRWLTLGLYVARPGPE